MQSVLPVVLTGFFCFAASTFAQATNSCDLNGDQVVNDADVHLAVDMTLGRKPCTANVTGANVCNVAMVQRVVNSALGGACGTGAGPAHSVQLNWLASTSANVAGYNVHRATAPGGPYTLLTITSRVAGTTYTDNTVEPGRTYYYVVTAVDNANNSSVYSNQATAVVPSP